MRWEPVNTSVGSPPPDFLELIDILSSIRYETDNIKIGTGNIKGVLQIKNNNVVNRIHEQSGQSIYLRGIQTKYRFELKNQENKL